MPLAITPIRLNAFPALAVGLIVAAYWWRVARMAMKMRRRTGRAANFVPTERTGKFLRFLWQPVVWIWIIHPFVTALSISSAPLIRPLFTNFAVQSLAALVAVAALIATRICWRKMGSSWRMGIDPSERTMLVINGPYAYVRHPIYALSSLLMICTMVVIPTPLMLVTGIIHLLLLQWEARREEHYLSTIHGQSYDRYCATVGRFIPRAFRPYTSAAT